MKNILQISLWATVFAGIMVIFGFAVAEQKRTVCSGISIMIGDGDSPGFINAAEITAIIEKHFGKVEGRHLDSINTAVIAAALRNNPYVREAHVYKSIQGQISVELSRSKALIRVINKSGQAFYIGTLGEILPVSRYFIPKTLVASGNISINPEHDKDGIFKNTADNSKDFNLLRDLYTVAQTLKSHPVFSKSIVQIYLNSKGDMELLPAGGGHIILIGDAANLDIKLENLLAFYEAGAPKLNEKDYRIIDLKYNDLVVCKK